MEEGLSASSRARQVRSLLPALCALAGFSAAPIDSGILFPGDAAVPRSVREFAWRVIETSCNYQSYERMQRSFWAYDANPVCCLAQP
jgi:hypothetical protein